MHFHRVLYKWRMHWKSSSITTDPNTAQNKNKSIDLVIRIELTRSILSSQLSDFLRNSTIYFLCVYISIACFLRVTVSLLCLSKAVSRILVPIYNYIISEGSKNCFSLETDTATKPWLSGNMLPNIKICENEWSNYQKIWES